MAIKKVHFIGIGGIGVSAIARMMLEKGNPSTSLRARKVSGSDLSESPITRELERLGAKIYYKHNAKNVRGADLVVYTPAVAKNNPELLAAKRFGIPALSYPEMLGKISKEKYTIAVSGAHGKTTTTAMLGSILKAAKLSPTIIVGSLLKDGTRKARLHPSDSGPDRRSRILDSGRDNPNAPIRTNFIAGRGKYFVVEACEYRRSFLYLYPRVIVITNIDNDHLDYYKNIKNIQNAFSEFVSKLKADDYLVCNPAGRYIKPVVKSAKCRIVDYTKSPRNFKLKIPGKHNLDNARAAFAAAKVLNLANNLNNRTSDVQKLRNIRDIGCPKIKNSTIKKSLENFPGTWRRFEYKGKTPAGALVYDDYAHHPTEIKATLAAARETFGNRKIFCVFQPHLYSRTKLLINDFAKSFGNADAVIVTDIYAAREKDRGEIHSRDLIKKMASRHKNARYVDSFGGAAEILKAESRKGDLILTMGAGDIYKAGNMILTS